MRKNIFTTFFLLGIFLNLIAQVNISPTQQDSPKVSENITDTAKHKPSASAAIGDDLGETYFDNLDKVLEPNMAATLAGLSLAALALIISLVPGLETKLLQAQQLTVTGVITQQIKDEIIKQEQTKLNNVKNAITNLKNSFYCFVGFLAETITIDIGEEKGGFLNSYSFAEPVDLAISGGLLAIGIYYITVGAKKMADAI